MASEPEYAPGESAPETGMYELLRIMGSPTETRVHVEAGKALPPAPFGWAWRLMRGCKEE